jgi:acetyl-CoA C-acetyltransferase
MLYTATGGNTPQWLVNRTAEEIARGECEVALLTGAEYIASLLAAMKAGVDLGWGSGPEHDPGSDPEEIGDQRPGTTEYEARYGLRFPVNVYPLFENALRGQAGRSPEAHLKWLGEFFSPFTKVASENPYSWFPTFRSPQEISTPSEKNRFVGFPYTKYLNAVIEVDQAAAVVMTSVGKARERGIPESRWVYLHGCGDANDIWNVSERVNYHSSPAIREIGKRAFTMAGKGVADLSFIDLYSCFPSAVEIGCAELGIATDDPHGLTVTGGLPYFGGAGNDYVMHSIVTMMQKLRAKPGAFGLCTGNGWYVTKHSAGVYSTTPREGAWQRDDPKSYQKDIDAMAHPEVIERPSGRATVETYTVVTNRKGKRFGLIVGRDAQNRRFFANTPDDDMTLDRMMREEMLGRSGEVTPGQTNLFRLS